MKFFRPLIAALFLVGAAPAVAQPDNSDALRTALNAMILQSMGDDPPGQSKRPQDPDQGDDNAALRAILEVCDKSTPAADRSAICRGGPISPQ